MGLRRRSIGEKLNFIAIKSLGPEVHAERDEIFAAVSKQHNPGGMIIP
jgi:hypothetical protein